MKLSKSDIELLNAHTQNGYLNTCQKGNLTLYNYNAVVQFGKLWDDMTLMCRGLILDDEYNIIARPLKKFFNYEELDSSEIPNLPFVALEKIDGSCGILYFIDDEPCIATRGSFYSEQAQKGTEILKSKYGDLCAKLDKSKTYVFEIVYPENVIVCRYNITDLFLLAIIDNETGLDCEIPDDLCFPRPQIYDCTDYNTIKNLYDDTNKEGFVIKFSNSFRMKIKFDEYKRLHKLFTGLNNVRVWECLMNGDSMQNLLESVPDEFYTWLTRVIEKLKSEYARIERHCQFVYDNISSLELETRKEVAEIVLKEDAMYRSIIFNMIDNRDYTKLLWRQIKPEYDKPYYQNADVD